MAWFWEDWFKPQKSNLFPQSEVTQAVQSGSAVRTTPQYTKPATTPAPAPAPSTAPAQTPWPNTQPTPYTGGYPQWPQASTTTPAPSKALVPTTSQPAGKTDQPMTFEEWLQTQEQYAPEYTYITPYQQALLDAQTAKAAADKWRFEEQQKAEQQQQADLAAYRQQQMMIEQQRMAQEQAQYQAQLAAEEKARLAQLAAQPISWLQYAAQSGQPPVIQPWMMPLMPQDYGIESAGSPIPGWTPESGQAMPQLTNPSTQYQARMGPTAQKQYLGYEQAKTGATPEETQWRLWQRTPPSGANRGLNRVR